MFLQCKSNSCYLSFQRTHFVLTKAWNDIRSRHGWHACSVLISTDGGTKTGLPCLPWRLPSRSNTSAAWLSLRLALPFWFSVFSSFLFFFPPFFPFLFYISTFRNKCDEGCLVISDTIKQHKCLAETFGFRHLSSKVLIAQVVQFCKTYKKSVVDRRERDTLRTQFIEFQKVLAWVARRQR